MTKLLYQSSTRLSSSQASMAGNSSPSPSPSPSQSDRELIEDLVRAYLDHSGMRCSACAKGKGPHPTAVCRAGQQQQQQQQHRRSLSPLVKELSNALISLTDEYERRYSSQLDELRANWVIDGESPRDSFQQVLDNIFLDGCNWGRFVTIFVFASMFLCQCQQQRGAVSVTPSDVHKWSVDYIACNVLPWVKRNGDWMGLIRFYKDGETVTREDNHTLKRLLTVAGAGLALMGLTSFLVNRA